MLQTVSDIEALLMVPVWVVFMVWLVRKMRAERDPAIRRAYFAGMLGLSLEIISFLIDNYVATFTTTLGFAGDIVQGVAQAGMILGAAIALCGVFMGNQAASRRKTRDRVERGSGSR